MFDLSTLPLSYSHFDYDLLLSRKLSLAAFILLILTFCACYFFKHYFLRGVFLFLALLLALYAGRVDWIGLAIILGFMGIFYLSIYYQKKLIRNLCYFFTLISCILFMLTQTDGPFKAHGIYNWWFPFWGLSANAIPYSLKFTFDKSMIGLCFIWFSTLSLANSGKMKPVLKTGFISGCLAASVLIPLSFILGFVTLDIKITNFIWLWGVNNLFFVVFAEEALFRGLIQASLAKALQNMKGGNWIALIIAAILFGGVHYAGGSKYMFLATIAGLFYGYAFMKTQKIEASVLTHFIVNTLHFVAFTYPALKTAF